MVVPFLAQEISGLAQPTYSSGAANKEYVDNIKGTTITWGILQDGNGISDFSVIVSGAGASVAFDTTWGDARYYTQDAADGQFQPSGSAGTSINWETIQDGAGISDFTGVISGSSPVTVSFDTTWGDARYYTQDTADAAFAPSGVDYLTEDEADAIYAPSSHTHDIYLTEDEADALYAPSGVDYLTQDEGDAIYEPSGLYSYGWANVSDGGTIAHSLSVQPTHFGVTPSGSNAFGVVTSVDATNITVNMTCLGEKTVNWWAHK